MLAAPTIPGLFITGTDTGVGKTLVAAAIAHWFRRRKCRIAVCKPIATGCVHRREGLVSEDAEFLAHHAGAQFPLHVICPQRYAEPLAPAIAAERAKQPIEWTAVDSALQEMCRESDVVIVEGIGGIMVPLDASHTVLDLARWLKLPTVIVARSSLGTINHTLLTIAALRGAGVPIAGIVINQFPGETPPVADETSPRAIERWGDVPILCLVPQYSGPAIPRLPATSSPRSTPWIGGRKPQTCSRRAGDSRIVPSHKPLAITTDPKLDPQQTGAISITSADAYCYKDKTILDVQFIENHLVVDCWIDSVISINGREWHGGSFLELGSFNSITRGGFCMRFGPLPSDVQTVDLELRPDLAAADRAQYGSVLWGKSMIFRDVPLHRRDFPWNMPIPKTHPATTKP